MDGSTLSDGSLTLSMEGSLLRNRDLATVVIWSEIQLCLCLLVRVRVR